jgi:hypothetical protein
VGDVPCACVFRGYLLDALPKSRNKAGSGAPGAGPSVATHPRPPAQPPVAEGPSSAESSGLVRSFVPRLAASEPAVGPDGVDAGPGDWPEVCPPGATPVRVLARPRQPDGSNAQPRPVPSGDPFAPGGLLAPGGSFRPPGPSGWVGQPVPDVDRASLSSTRHRVRAGIAVGVTTALVVALVGVYLQRRSSQAYPSQWDPRVAAIVPFVEQHRGLKFLHPVAVDFLPEDQFKLKVGAAPAPTAKQQVDLGHTVGELRAMGLIHGDVDLTAMGKQVSEQSVIGLYVPKDKRVYVRGTALTPDVRVTLAHELTHALQDQHFDLRRVLHLPHVDSTAVLTLVEGDALRVQRAYAAAMSTEDKATYQKTGAAQAQAAYLTGVPQVFIDGFSAPYIFGPVFVDALVASGGTAAIDHAFANPPTVDAQVVDPNRYLIQTDVAIVPPPAVVADDTRLSSPLTVGQVGMLQVIGATVGYQEAWSALQSWRGDQVVGYLHSGQVCLAIASVFDGPEHAAAFAVLAGRWAAGRSRASVATVDKKVVLRSCDPGPAAAVDPASSPTPFAVLTLRSSVIGDLIDNAKAPADVAGCIADQVILTVGPGPLMVPPVPGAPGNPAVARASAQAAKACGFFGP